eukprot:TRINITY_DN2634_c0_g1_i1.p1 TRINITY_DN2634_c0_g1~~TRINITY_DN2634_c0_g1_i1.p1  ORF type:complete len:705 (+),score=132.34 TRINITY_DN2634_c0_g1_i1:78-2192(+)
MGANVGRPQQQQQQQHQHRRRRGQQQSQQERERGEDSSTTTENDRNEAATAMSDSDEFNAMEDVEDDINYEEVEEDDDLDDEDYDNSDTTLFNFINTISMLRHGRSQRFQTNERAPSEFMKWPVRYRIPLKPKEVENAVEQIVRGEELIMSIYDATEPKSPDSSMTGEKIAESHNHFECARNAATGCAGLQSSRIRFVAIIGILLCSCKQRLPELLERLSHLIEQLIREPVVRCYFSQRTMHFKRFLRLYAHTWRRLTQKSGEPPLLDLISTLFQQPLFADKDSVAWKLYEEANNKLSVFRSGHFGRNMCNSINTNTLLRTRAHLNGFNRRQQVEIGQSFLPSAKSKKVITTHKLHRHRAYNGQFSEDGTLFYASWQDMKICVFDTSRMGSNSNFKIKKEIEARRGQWTITDCRLSSDNRFLVYSSITPFVHLCQLDWNSRDRAVGQTELVVSSHGGVWAIRLSNDNRELLSGTNRSTISIYDFDAGRLSFQAGPHQDDVNAVCFLENSNSQVFVTGSDDSYIKIFDRRSPEGQDGRASGVLAGHTEGVTYVASKGDGVYLLSNAKDQTMKLWDIRKMSNSTPRSVPGYNWDYRFQPYPGNPFLTSLDRKSQDQSVLTCIGHKVLQTLIRCNFSPASTTGQRYLYTGSQDGAAYIYDLGGSLVRRLPDMGDVVRDVSWHPYDPCLVATSWDGNLYCYGYAQEDE